MDSTTFSLLPTHVILLSSFLTQLKSCLHNPSNLTTHFLLVSPISFLPFFLDLPPITCLPPSLCRNHPPELTIIAAFLYLTVIPGSLTAMTCRQNLTEMIIISSLRQFLFLTSKTPNSLYCPHISPRLLCCVFQSHFKCQGSQGVFAGPLRFPLCTHSPGHLHHFVTWGPA